VGDANFVAGVRVKRVWWLWVKRVWWLRVGVWVERVWERCSCGACLVAVCVCAVSAG
jgi:hypothetical protein